MAAVVWLAGGIVLLLKGGSLLAEAHALEPGQVWLWLAVILGLSLGSLKARYLFSGNCRKNLDRIDALERPRLWQSYRPRFYVFLAMMILFGATLSRLAHGNHPFLIGVAVLDISIAVALLGSSHHFWKRLAAAQEAAAVSSRSPRGIPERE